METSNTTEQITTNSTIHSDSISFSAGPETVGQTVYMGAASSATMPLRMDPMQMHGIPAPKLGDMPSRPISLVSGNFSNNAYGIVTTDQCFSNSFANHLSTLDGVLGVRFTVCYRIEIANTPQTSGIVKLAWHPFVNGGSAIAPCISCQVANSEVNLAEGNVAELRIPWFHYRDYLERMNWGSESFGALQVVAYAPVQWDAASSPGPSYVLYRWLEDVEPIGNTVALVTAEPQSGLHEEKVMATGPVTKWLRFGSTVAKAVGNIPELSAFAVPVSWMLSGASSIAAYFGWSKPLNNSFDKVVVSSICRANNTALDNDFANTTALFSNNEIAVMPSFAGKNVDEMSICYVTCIPGMINTILLLQTDAPNQLKWTCPIDPSCFYRQTANRQASMQYLFPTSGAGNFNKFFYPSPLMYIAGMFNYWRGDIVFRFKFARTKYHTGKVLIGYAPSGPFTGRAADGGVNFMPDFTKRMTYDSVLVDLRSTSEVDFKVPFTYQMPWCRTNSTFKENLSAVGAQGDTGFIFMQIVDSVSGPSNVPATVPVIIEVMADSGVKFAVPVTPTYQPCDTAGATAVAQSGLGQHCSVVNLDPDKYCIGETIQSLKMLIKRPLWKIINPETTTRITADPGTIYKAILQPTPVLGVSDWYPTSGILDIIGCMYALYRGSIILKHNYTGGETTGKALRVTVAHSGSLAQPKVVHQTYACENFAPNNIHAPFYSQTSRLPVIHYPTTNTLTKVVEFDYFNGAGQYDNALYGLCAGDDFQYGYFRGVPACGYVRYWQ